MQLLLLRQARRRLDFSSRGKGDIESHLYAVVNVNTFDGIDPSSLARARAHFEGETSDARLARRNERWIAHVSIKR